MTDKPVTISDATSLRERVASGVCAIIAREIRCGQSPEMPADDRCKTTWLPYGRQCPECPLHHTQRADLATEMADAAISLCREEFARVFEEGAHEAWTADEAASAIRSEGVT